MSTPERIVADIATVNGKIRTATDKLSELQERRRVLYLDARAVEPPIPFRRLAEAAGTTEAAVMQVLAKAQDAIVSPALVRVMDPKPTPAEVRKITQRLIADTGNPADAAQAAAGMSDKALRSLLS